MATDKESKTEKPTERRLTDAEKKGDVPRSKDMAASTSLLFTILFFVFFMPYFAEITVNFWKQYFGEAGEMAITPASISFFGKDFFNTYLKLILPLFLLLILVAFLVELVQSGAFRIVSENLRIKWEKVFFLAEIPKGLKKILMSAEALFELAKSILKVAVIFAIAYLSIRSDIPAILQLPKTPLMNILITMGRVFLKLAFSITVFLLLLSVLDYLWQRYRYMNKLKMSKQDVKDEFKQAEGDPQVKSRQKRIQFQWAMRRMMAEVPEADVVITNPTHYAAALKYESPKMHSPQVVAKGKDLVAQRIKEVAREHDVPVVENPPVAQAIFGAVEIGEFIPEKLFKPVAEILAYIYKLKGKRVN
jgi:flagellar biosynthetic protein FlhB